MPTLQLKDFRGGLNLTGDPLDLELSQSPLLRNMQIAGNGGAISNRPGDQVIAGGVAPVDPDGIYFTLTGGGSLLLTQQSTGKIYAISLAGARTLLRSVSPAGHASPMTFAEAVTSGGQGPLYGLVPHNVSPWTQPVYMTFTAGVPSAIANWTASVGTLPLGRFLLWASNRMWAFGEGSNLTVADSEHTYWWSEIGDPRNWPAANINKLDPGDGDRITAAAALGSGIVVFKQRKAWNIYDLDTGANRPLAYGTGAIDLTNVNVNTAITTSSGVIFIDPDQGLMVTDGSSVKRLDSSQRVDVLGTIVPALASMVSAGNSVFFGLTTGEIYEFDLLHDSWWLHDGGGLMTASPIADGSGPPIYRTVWGTASLIDRFRGASPTNPLYSNGAPLLLRYTTPWLTAGMPTRLKRFGPLYVRGRSLTGSTALVRHDLLAATWGSRTLPFTNTAAQKVRANDLGVSEALQVQFNDLLSLSSLELDYMARGRR